MVIVHIEGKRGVENLDDIVEVSGTDVLFLGPYDSSQPVGITGRVHDQQVEDLMSAVCERAAEEGKIVGTYADDPEMARKWIDAGAQYVAVAVDGATSPTPSKILSSKFASNPIASRYFYYHQVRSISMELDQLTDEFDTRDWQNVTETDDPVRFAMIGLGWWTREQAMPAIEAGDLCETTVVVSGDPEKARSVAAGSETVEHAMTYDEFHDGAASDAYDAVYVVTPNARHLPFVETAAQLGKAVLCEKPMEATIDRAERIVEVCADNDATLMIAYRMHTEPAVRRAKDLLDAGYIGDPVFIHGNMTEPILELVPDPDQWRLDWELSGGCATMDIGIYSLNTSRFLLGADPESVMGSVASVHEAFDDVPDEHVAFQVDFPGNTFALCTASQNAHMASHIRVTGTTGELLVEPAFYPWDDRKLTFSRNGTTMDIEFEQVDQMEEEFAYFAHCLLTGTEPHADGEHGLTDIETIKGVYESAESGRRVDLD